LNSKNQIILTKKDLGATSEHKFDKCQKLRKANFARQKGVLDIIEKEFISFFDAKAFANVVITLRQAVQHLQNHSNPLFYFPEQLIT